MSSLGNASFSSYTDVRFGSFVMCVNQMLNNLLALSRIEHILVSLELMTSVLVVSWSKVRLRPRGPHQARVPDIGKWEFRFISIDYEEADF